MSPLKKHETPPSIAEMRSLADEAEAEAAEAEALAAAARARARAIRLRREAELVETTEVDTKTVQVDGKKVDLAKAAAAAEQADTVQAEVPDTEAADAPEEDPEEDYVVEVDRDAEEDADDVVPDADVAVDDEADEDEAAEEADKKSGRRWLGRLRRPNLKAVAAVLAVLVVLFAVGASVEMSVLHRNASRERQQVAEFAAAARQGVVTLTSLDFAHAKEGVQHILEVSTGTFKDDFLKMADDFTKTVEESKVISQGSVQATAVELDTMTENSAVVLVASTAEVTNSAGAKQDPRKYRLIVTMTRDGGQLKMAKVEFVP